MKIGVSVGGWTRSGDFPIFAADASKRKNFAKNIAKFIDYLRRDLSRGFSAKIHLYSNEYLIFQ